MSTNYLIDYENVNRYGLEGIKRLSSDDKVFILYTKNANMIGLDCFDRVSARLSFINVKPGDQSLDMHLSTILGNLICKYPNEKFAVISRDSDYDGIIGFWQKELGSKEKVKKQTSIDPDYVKRHTSDYDKVRESIFNIIRDHAENGSDKIPLTNLCRYLKNSIAYKVEKGNRNAKDFFMKEFSDLIRIDTINGFDWVQLLERSSENKYKQFMIDNGIDILPAEEIIPVIIESKTRIHPSVDLYNKMRHMYGIKLGTKYYNTIREVLNA